MMAEASKTSQGPEKQSEESPCDLIMGILQIIWSEARAEYMIAYALAKLLIFKILVEFDQ